MRLIFLLFLLLQSSLLINAEKYNTLPEILDGSMMPYNFSNSDTLPIWDDNMHPVYISYVARHGARYISSARKVTQLRDILYPLAVTGGLTKKGEKLLELTGKVIKASEGNWGELSSVGIYEQHRLASQIHTLVPEITRKGRFYACATYVPRVVMTMNQFCWQIDKLQNSVELYEGAGKRYDKLLRFFATDKDYSHWRKDGEWKEVVKEFMTINVPEKPAASLFLNPEKLSADSLRNISMMEYDLLQSLRAMAFPAPDNYFMSEEEYYSCWLTDNLEHYFRNSISPLNASSATAASYFLNTIIENTDAVCNADNLKSDKTANLYFGHAETLMPLFSLMNLPGCRSLPNDYNDVAKEWNIARITPLGANLLLIFLRGDDEKLYVATRLNGHFIEPVKEEGLIIEWQKLKNYWINQINAFELPK